MKYILDKKIDGQWWFEGAYTERCINALASAIFLLGHCGNIEDVRIIIVAEDFDTEAYKNDLVKMNMMQAEVEK